MHDWLFENQGTWQAASAPADEFRKQALAFGADGGKFDACLADAKTEAKVQADLKDAASLGVRATPSFFLYKMQGGKETGSPTPIVGMAAIAQFSQSIDALLK